MKHNFPKIIAFVYIFALAFGIAQVDAHKIGPNGEVVPSTPSTLMRQRSSGDESLDRRLNPIGIKQNIVLLLKSQDSSVSPFTAEEAKTRYFDGLVNSFFREISYGKFYFDTRVVGWRTFNAAGISCTDSGVYTGSRLESEISRILLEENILLSDYDFLTLIVVNNLCPSSGGGGGSHTFYQNGRGIRIPFATIDVGPLSFNRWGNHSEYNVFSYVLNHELEHAVGLNHAAYTPCNGGSDSSDDCVYREYSPFDNIGYGHIALTLNSVYREFLGWLDSTSLFRITHSGRYTIKPLNSTSGYRAAKIVVGNNSPYYMEYRLPRGFDSALANDTLNYNTRGLFIYSNAPFGDNSISILLRVVNPSNMQPSQVTLNGNEQFEDRSRGIKIGPIISVDESGITFDVTIPQSQPCVHRLPFIVGYQPQIAFVQFVQTNIQFQNRDTEACGASDFLVNTTTTLPLPDGWEMSPVRVVTRVNPGQMVYTGRVIRNANNPRAGVDGHTGHSIEIENTLQNITANTPSVVAGRTIIRGTLGGPLNAGPRISTVTPTFVTPGSRVTIEGQGFPNPSTVEIKFPYGARIFLPNMQTNGTSISFQVPTTGIIEGNEMADGEYIISVGSGQGTSNYLALTYSSGGAGPAPVLDLAPTRTTVVTTATVRVRTATSLVPDTVRGTAPVGTIGSVILGPRFAENYRWWYVDFGGNVGEGWVVANFIRAVSAPSIDPPAIVRIPVPSTAIPQTNAVLYRVKYTAPASRDIPLRSAPLALSSQNVSLPYGLSVYAYSDAAFSIRAFDSQPIGQLAPVSPNGEVQIPLLVNEIRSPVIPAGQTRYFEVRGDVLVINSSSARLSVRVPGLEEEVFQVRLPSQRPGVETTAPAPSGTAPLSFITTTANTLIIRDTPNGTEIGRVILGVGGAVVDGPVTAGQYQWFRVRFNGSYPEGWVAGDYLQFVGGPAPAPAPATPTSVTPTVRPVVTRIPVPSTTLPQSNAVLYRVAYTAPASAAWTHGNGSLIVTRTGVNLSNFAIFAYSDPGFSIRAYDANPLTTLGNLDNVNIRTRVNYNFSPVTIPAGATRYFELRGDVTGGDASAYLAVEVEGLQAEEFRRTPLAVGVPRIISLTPREINLNRNNVLTVRGENFPRLSAVEIITPLGQSIFLNNVVTDGSVFSLQVPPDGVVGGVRLVSGPVDGYGIRVGSSQGTSSPAAFTYSSLAITSQSHYSVSPGTLVTLSGFDFPTLATVQITFPDNTPVFLPNVTTNGNSFSLRVPENGILGGRILVNGVYNVAIGSGRGTSSQIVLTYSATGTTPARLPLQRMGVEAPALRRIVTTAVLNVRPRQGDLGTPLRTVGAQTPATLLEGPVNDWVRVRFSDGLEGWILNRIVEAVVSTPIIASIEPSTVRPGQSFTISGQGFASPSKIKVTFPDGSTTDLPNVRTNGTLIVLQIPADGVVGGVTLSTGRYIISVGSEQGPFSNAMDLNYFSGLSNEPSAAALRDTLPGITLISPDTISPGRSFFIVGRNFPNPSTVGVTLPNASTIYLNNVPTNGTSITLTVPANGVLNSQVLYDGVYGVQVGSALGTSSVINLTYSATGTPARLPLQRMGVEAPAPAPSGTALANRLTVLVNVLNVRASANGAYAGQVTRGSSGTVVDGPITTGGYTWWRVRFDNVSDGEGWIAGGGAGVEYVQFVGGGAQAARQSIGENVSLPLITSLTPTAVPGSSIVIGGGSFPNPSTVEITFPDGRQTYLANIPTNGSSITLTVPTNGYLNGIPLGGGSYGVRVGSGPGSRMSNSFSLSYSASGGTGVAPALGSQVVPGGQIAPPPATVNPAIYSISPPSGTLPAGQASQVLVYGVNFNSSATLEYRSSSTTPGVWVPLEAVLAGTGIMSLHPSQTQGFGAGTFSVRVRNTNTGLASEPFTYVILAGSTSASAPVGVSTPPPPPGAVVAVLTVNGYDNVLTVGAGSDVTVNWASANVSDCSVSPYGWSGTSGSQVIRSVAAGTYTAVLTCGGVNGGARDTFTLTVQSGQITPPAPAAVPPSTSVPTPTISAITRNSIPAGVSTFLRIYGLNFREGIQLYYNGAAYPVTYENPGEVSLNSGVLNTGSYSFTLRNPGSPDSNAITVTVTPPVLSPTPSPTPTPPPPASSPTADIKANGLDGLTVTTGTAITVTWVSTNVSSCSVTPYGWTGTTGRQDYPTGLAAGTYTATLNCSGSQSSAVDFITVTVNAASSPPAPAAPPPPPPTAPEPPPPDDKLQYYKGAVGDAPVTREILAALHGALESLRSFLSQYR